MASAQVGVKRPASAPALVPGDDPGFRGLRLGPADAIKTPRLEAGNLNNRTSNVQVVTTRVVTESSVTLAAGRLGPGEICFMRKNKARFYSQTAGIGMQQICEMLGVDGANRLLAGEMDGSGMVVGSNVLDLNDPNTPHAGRGAAHTRAQLLPAPLFGRADRGRRDRLQRELEVL